MTKSRMLLVAAVAALAVMLIGGAGPAAAQASSTPMTKKVAVTGTGKGGKKFTGTYTIQRFTHRGSKLYAVGTLKGRLKGRKVTRKNVRMPASIQRPASASQLPVPTPGACPVLNLVLGPIDLNLLGLRVATNQIRLLIEAVPGAGNLLGNLLCGVAGILDPQAATPASPSLLSRVLTALLALVPATP